MDSTLQGIYLNIPQSDVKKYIATRPKQVNLSDDEILSELAVVRYKK